jgi:hypothetical protein
MASELGCHWGDFPVGFAYFRSIYALDLLSRLALFNGTSEQKAMWRHSHRRKVLLERGQQTIARVFDYLLADEVPHVHNGVRWGTHLLGGDERAYRETVRELRAGLDATGQPVAGLMGSFERPRRPVLPLLEIAREDVSNGLRSHSPSLPGALPAPRPPVLTTFWPPRSGWRERRGIRNARIRISTQKAMTAPMTMAASYPVEVAITLRRRARAGARAAPAARSARPTA